MTKETDFLNLEINDDSSDDLSLELDIIEGERCPSGHNSFIKDSKSVFSQNIIQPDKNPKMSEFRCKNMQFSFSNSITLV